MCTLFSFVPVIITLEEPAAEQIIVIVVLHSKLKKIS